MLSIDALCPPSFRECKFSEVRQTIAGRGHRPMRTRYDAGLLHGRRRGVRMSDQSDDTSVDMAERLNLSVPHSARVYDYFLGGKTNFAADRAVAEHLLEAFPGFRTAAQSTRMWMHRAARYVAEQGITQFLDIGTGIPTSPNLREVVQQIVPEARVVYADNDPIVLTHSRALLVSSPSG